jgi:hypothetical protein
MAVDGELLSLAACRFRDIDGIDVIATLYAKGGQPVELDVWKADFGPLRKIPDELEIIDER